MAMTTPDTNNKLVKFVTEINREYVRENLFSPYMSEDLNAIFRKVYANKSGGEQANIPLVTSLKGRGKGVGALVGNEEKIDNYGMRVWLDWARHAITTNKANEHKDSADIFGEARPLLSDWGKERQRDDLIEAMMALPSEAAPAGLGSDDGDTVNGIRFQDATAAQRNAWTVSNQDRIQFGALASNFNATFATALANVDNTADKLTAPLLGLMKRRARNASPRIRPFKIKDGREYFVAFADSYSFRDLKQSLETINKDARPREAGGMENNPLFQDGDQIYDGVIVREIPEMSEYVDQVWSVLKTGGAAGIRTAPVFLCGQQAATISWGQAAMPTFRKEDDYGFIKGVGVQMAYGVAKMFKKHGVANDLKQWGVFTGFVASVADA